MRVIAGLYKNRSLAYPKNIRPASQLQKKAIFDIIRPWLTNQNFLDLCAGSGQIGIEALSQGAVSVTFVEKISSHLAVLKSNLRLLKIPASRYQIKKTTVRRYISFSDQRHDIIFADPPYFDIDWTEFIEINKIMHPDSIFILKFSPHQPPPVFPRLQIFKTKIFKDTHINFYQPYVTPLSNH
ncbi:MAG TPA: RsmD family RNA methyltransferase [bacterium]|nr:RsmD family RNA methyltransferase [bacterium]HPN67789.1 RsmD family RNA methyltransferase [bacterium]